MKTKRTRRLLSIVLSIVMVAGFMPITANAVTVLDSVSMTVLAPAEGQHPNTEVVPLQNMYTPTVVRWYHNDNLPSSPLSTMMSASDEFVAGEKYIVEIIISPKSGYTLGLSTTGTINGKSAYSGGVNDKGEKLFRVMLTVSHSIWEVSATATAPVAGETPSELVTTGDSSKYSVELDSWRVGGSSLEYTSAMDDGEKFEAGKTYLLLLKFDAAEDFSFADEDGLYAVINDEPAKYLHDYILDGNRALVYYYIVYTIPEEKPEIISFASATVTKPEPGAHPDFNPVSGDSSKYKVSVSEWTLEGESQSTVLTPDYVFEYGKKYQLHMEFTFNPGYGVDSTTNYSINGDMDLGTVGWSETTITKRPRNYYYTTRAGIVINSASATMTAPVVGAKPSDNVTSGDPDKYSAYIHNGLIGWYKGDTWDHGVKMSYAETFKAGQTYWVLVECIPKDGYAFDEYHTVIKINGQPATLSRSIGYRDGRATFYIPFTLPGAGVGTVSGTVTGWNNTNDARYYLYSDSKSDADIKTDIQSATPTGTAATNKGTITANADGKRYNQTFSFSAVAAGTYKLAVFKPGKYVVKVISITVGTSDYNMNTNLYSGGECKLWLYGDVNYDGKVNSTDTMQINRYFAGKSSQFTIGTEQDILDRFEAANVTKPANNDTLVNSTDVSQIQRYYAGKTSVFDAFK